MLGCCQSWENQKMLGTVVGQNKKFRRTSANEMSLIVSYLNVKINFSGRKTKINDCYGILERSAWIWRIFGIFPLTVKRTRATGKYEISQFGAVYSFLMCFASIANFLYAAIHYSITKKYYLYKQRIWMHCGTFNGAFLFPCS